MKIVIETGCMKIVIVTGFGLKALAWWAVFGVLFVQLSS
jgi:hypothetical protein